MIEDDNLGFVSAFGILRDGSVLCGCGAGKLFQLNPNFYSCYLVKENAHSSDVVSIIELDDSINYGMHMDELIQKISSKK